MPDEKRFAMRLREPAVLCLPNGQYFLPVNALQSKASAPKESTPATEIAVVADKIFFALALLNDVYHHILSANLQ